MLLYSHTESAHLHRWDPNSWWPDASCRRAAHRECRGLAPAFTHRISVFTHRIRAISTVGIRIPDGQTLPAAVPTGCTSWVETGACSCIHTQNQRFHTQNQCNLYHLHPNSWRPDASCCRAAHRGCQALAPAFTHRISAISAVGIRIPGGQTLPANSICRLPGGQTLPAAGLTIVGAGRLLLHSHTESVFSHTESAQSAQS